jgi:exopolysaccharide production protein ExoZ
MINSIQYIRGIASMLVVGFHARKMLNSEGFMLGEILFGKGHEGVEIFFFISGFIISYTSLNKINNFNQLIIFFKKRFFRIWPLYFIITLVTVFYFEFFIGQINFFAIIKSLLFIPSNDSPILYVGWSINYEIFYYLIYGLSGLIFSKKINNIILILWGVLIIGNHFINFSHDLFLTKINHLFFISGVLVGRNLETILKLNLKQGLLKLILSISLFLYLLSYLKLFNYKFDLYINLTILITSIIILEIKHKFKLNSRLLNKLGDYSYSIYLIHPIVIFILPEILFKLKVYHIFSNEIIFLMIFTFTIIISHFSFIFIEKGLYNFFINKKR